MSFCGCSSRARQDLFPTRQSSALNCLLVNFMKVRAAAIPGLCFQVVEQGYSLSAALPAAQQLISSQDRALLQRNLFTALCVG